MNPLRQAIQNYLDLRRNLGFKLKDTGRWLSKFADFLDARSAPFVTTKLALEWAQQDPTVLPSTCAQRLGFVRGFARYQIAVDPRTEIPPPGLLPFRPSRPRPFLYSQEQVEQLLSCALALPSTNSLRPWTYHCLLGLLCVTGMRIGEAIRLQLDDANLQEGLLTLRGTKFGKSRLVPIHPSTQEVLAQYRHRRERCAAAAASSFFFINSRGHHLDIGDIHRTFYVLSHQIGLRAANARHGPRLHDFRHRFAIETLLRWYRSGAEVDRNLPLLSTYLGHVHVADTYWYLTGYPELMQQAMARLEQRWEQQP